MVVNMIQGLSSNVRWIQLTVSMDTCSHHMVMSPSVTSLPFLGRSPDVGRMKYWRVQQVERIAIVAFLFWPLLML